MKKIKVQSCLDCPIKMKIYEEQYFCLDINENVTQYVLSDTINPNCRLEDG